LKILYLHIQNVRSTHAERLKNAISFLTVNGAFEGDCVRNDICVEPNRVNGTAASLKVVIMK
jgi:hypothetical protein